MRPLWVLECQERWWLWNAWFERGVQYHSRSVSPALLLAVAHSSATRLLTAALWFEEEIVSLRRIAPSSWTLDPRRPGDIRSGSEMDAGSLTAVIGQHFSWQYIKGRVLWMD